MSYSYREGKDEVHFLTEEDLKQITETAEDDDRFLVIFNYRVTCFKYVL